MKYYEVKAKCGHVGKNNYIIGTLFLWAESGKIAAAVARRFPRVKHDHKDAIISVREISRAAYEKGRKSINETPYWSCVSVQEQRKRCPELGCLILQEEKPRKRYKKTHSLRKNFNVDPLFTEYCTYRGDIQIAGL